MPLELQHLPAYLNTGQSLVAVESPYTERFEVLKFLGSVTEERQLPLYFWNPGYRYLQRVEKTDGKPNLIPSQFEIKNGLEWLLCSNEPGVFVFEGAIAPDNPNSEIATYQTALLTNIAYRLLGQSERILICLEPYVELAAELLPFVEIFSNPYPTAVEVEELCRKFCPQFACAPNSSKLIAACRGLHRGELELAFERMKAMAVNSLESSIELAIAYKKNKLRGRGVEFISNPDVPVAGGLDLLDAYLEKAASLLQPEAAEHNLSFPKGCILWGPPGTGKSLSAKLAAKKMGVPLLAVDWAGLYASTAYESRKNLKDFLDLCDNLAPVVVYFDDFDKGFASFQSDADGGISRQMAGKLLTWMQEHTSPVFVMATVNRLGFLPPELVRRFENNIFFVDLPNAGARYEIFKLHLAKYFPNLEISERDWLRLIRETQLLTPAEIASVVRKTAEEAFYRNTLRSKNLRGQPLEAIVQDFLIQRYSFTPSMIREEDAILEIRNQAAYATPASSPDTSKWAREPQPLFGAAPSSN